MSRAKVRVTYEMEIDSDDFQSAFNHLEKEKKSDNAVLWEIGEGVYIDAHLVSFEIYPIDSKKYSIKG